MCIRDRHFDTVYPQTLAQEKGVYSIGYNSDMSKDAPQSCLCSVVWNWSAYYTAAVQSVIDGSWDGSNYYGGMNENLVSITITPFSSSTRTILLFCHLLCMRFFVNGLESM